LIEKQGFIYSFFGRKRRLPNVKSTDRAIAAHEVRSGINSLVQSVASDVNLMGAVDAHREICERGYEKNMKIFALVHDSILAEVDDDYIQEYQNILLKNVQKDRGLSIPGSPIGCDFEIGNDYSMGKFEAKYETVE
jgi:DNA polymerase-1